MRKTIFLFLILLSEFAHAEVTNEGLMKSFLEKFKANAAGWGDTITSHATFLFWALATISMVWTFGMMALRRADIGEFFAEFIKFIMFTGFFWWLLEKAPVLVASIFDGLEQLAGQASGLPKLNPSGIIDMGFILFGKIIDNTPLWPTNAIAYLLIGGILGIAILVILSLIAINMLMLLISAWILAYGGILFLGFGGSRWTSDMAINYYKTVLSIGIQLFSMIILVGIGQNIILSYSNAMSAGEVKEIAVVAVCTLILYVLTNKIPPLLGGLVNGSSIGASQGLSTAGAGALFTAAGAAAAVASMAASAAVAGASNVAGGMQAIMNAVSKAGSNVEAGSDLISKATNAVASAGSFADAAGFGSSSTASSSGSSSDTTSSSGSSSDTTSSSGSSSDTTSSSGSSSDTTSSSGSSSDTKSSSGSSSDTTSSSSSSASSSSGKGSTSKKDGIGSKLAKAGKIAVEAGSILGSGIDQGLTDKTHDLLDKGKDRASNSMMGKLAQEIKNPGANAQARLDNQAISEANEIKSNQARSAAANEAREFINSINNGGNSESSTPNENSLSGEMESEIAAFRDRK
ncbi:TrbL/VirB6 plasmid conjugal transfer protein [Klebsiella pneumoniae]|uniref:P-type conjugative transfer protein TrbL n=4 Tax=Gammaproteobacteria TaxID=1236 RepID=UPI000741FE46|nr:P-type conjugative transfer protein TrbL [Klebsiella pneumoniae]MBV5954583.1 P-type conjugative transfer protein TrbL [Pseudomonas aeruginosa]KUF64217.1 TrbL/VirB6 plasmid conjugal transfer protein [Klebsiella pneumoniae]MBL9381146.1 P-type conjugative transfer protein TrbL [Klebsiella pneumoniae]MBL9642474.1 P-type conjugative transfer protein TrbL [Klebsiella pneumoniae]MBL9842920.1 P-type conjugative transfer protein TrbL [Klebsiella pneumoniae]